MATIQTDPGATCQQRLNHHNRQAAAKLANFSQRLMAIVCCDVRDSKGKIVAPDPIRIPAAQQGLAWQAAYLAEFHRRVRRIEATLKLLQIPVPSPHALIFSTPSVKTDYLWCIQCLGYAELLRRACRRRQNFWHKPLDKRDPAKLAKINADQNAAKAFLKLQLELAQESPD